MSVRALTDKKGLEAPPAFVKYGQRLPPTSRIAGRRDSRDSHPPLRSGFGQRYGDEHTDGRGRLGDACWHGGPRVPSGFSRKRERGTRLTVDRELHCIEVPRTESAEKTTYELRSSKDENAMSVAQDRLFDTEVNVCQKPERRDGRVRCLIQSENKDKKVIRGRCMSQGWKQRAW